MPRSLTLPAVFFTSAFAFGVVAWARAPHDPVSQVVLTSEQAPPGAVWLDSLDITKMAQRRGRPRVGRTVRGHPIVLGGVTYPHGIGTQSISEYVIDLKGQATRFTSMFGVDDEAKNGPGSVTVEVWLDDKPLLVSDVIHAGDPPRRIDVDLTSGHLLELFVDDGGDVSTGDNVSWGGALIQMKAGATATPEPWVMPAEPAPPIASATPPEPRINGPRITGGTPGRPFLFLVPATGEGPLAYTASNLPAGLSLDARTGIISGSLQKAGTTVAEIMVSGPRGTARRALTIVGGEDAVALTPPLGWNSWNAWGASVDDAKVRAAADWMVKSGLAAHGFQYIDIDDTWEGTRDADGVIHPNEKFPDMKALADYVHSKGLKLGIYSGPGPKTCEGFAGSYEHERQDAATWAAWGVDLLKYDWCSYDEIAKDHSLPELQKPYRIMRDALAAESRDIVYSLCQYGMGDVWTWGAEVGGNLWRTSGDLTDVWSNMASVGFRQAGREKWTRPGHWDDPDMLVVGKVGWGPNVHETRLRPNEQIVHLTLWSLEAAPLLIGADMSQLDPFTLALLGNDEVLAVDQDPLGHAASRVWRQDRLEVWSRPLADGTYAVGLFNRGLRDAKVTARWADIGVSGAQRVRDLWLQKDLGTFTGAFTTAVPRHGAVMIKVGRPHS